MEEIWKPVPEWETFYEVSSLGNVRRIAGTRNSLLLKSTLKQLLVNIDTGGYAQVVLQDKETCRRKTVTVHRLVLSAFVRLPNKEDHGMHLNDVRSDNRLVNLKWGTRQENARDMALKGRAKSGVCLKILSFKEVKAIENLPNVKRKVLAEKYGVPKSRIDKVRGKFKLKQLIK